MNRKFEIQECRVIQAMTFLSPNVGGHLPLKGSLNHPKKVTKHCQVFVFELQVCFTVFFSIRNLYGKLRKNPVPDGSNFRNSFLSETICGVPNVCN